MVEGEHGIAVFRGLHAASTVLRIPSATGEALHDSARYPSASTALRLTVNYTSSVCWRIRVFLIIYMHFFFAFLL
jgi:hypothetical protein